VLRKPSRKNYKYEFKRPNLIPILDAVFIFIFFLLLSANFLQVYEINSNVPTVSSAPPPKNLKPINLGLKIYEKKINIYTGIPWKLLKTIKSKNGEYNLSLLHDYLIAVKRKNLSERTITLEPKDTIEYESLVKIMDTVRIFRTTDPSLYIKTKDGMDQKVEILFDDIIFGNTKS
jgi:biopolymer transport protein ExbD